MPTATSPIPETLDRFLLTSSESDVTHLGTYFEKGIQLVTPDAIAAVGQMLPRIRRKAATVKDSPKLQDRIAMLALYLEETLGDASASPTAKRDAAFALLYFMKGYDRIPDSIPEIGFLDDAMIVEQALLRNLTSLRHHWLKRLRVWPANP